jgi:hypothetical protein
VAQLIRVPVRDDDLVHGDFGVHLVTLGVRVLASATA